MNGRIFNIGLYERKVKIKSKPNVKFIQTLKYAEQQN